MNTKIIPTQYLENTTSEFLVGNLTKCWSTWGFENCVPSYNKIYYVLSGEFFISVDGIEYIAKKGDLLLLPTNSIQTYHHISDDFATKYWFHFNMSCNEKDLFSLINVPFVIKVDNHDYITNLFDTIIFKTSQATIPSVLRRKAAIFELIAYYIEKSKTSGGRLIKDTKFSALLLYIEDNLNNEVTVNQLCEFCSMHPNYFIRYFKDHVGIPPMEYVNNLRIQKVKYLLETCEDTILNIALTSGFTSQYYLSRIFKSKTGFTPSQYRTISKAKLK